MKRNPVTVRLRHTGRVYIGMDFEHFTALYCELIWARETARTFRAPRDDQFRRDNIFSACEKFRKQLRDIAAREA